ncbi:MAG: FHA domain-containing protein [Planctomycetota bacterium]|nr:FHA domain-containing protein [Planctomycetota bacterium]MDA1140130.1 FHA domain-containing protein [Planctomycetota bacterium]
MATAKLVDNQTGKEFPLTSRVTRVGRKVDNDIVLNNRIISKYHFEIRRSFTGNYSIHDTGSTHGFYVNNQRIKDEQKLEDGDVLRVVIIYADSDGAEQDSGTSTFIARPQAIAKTKLAGDEENTSVACDFTFRQEGSGLLSFLGGKKKE